MIFFRQRKIIPYRNSGKQEEMIEKDIVFNFFAMLGNKNM
jgi:hypothetical protein